MGSAMQQRGYERGDAQRLQRCINDMVAVLALPAVWQGRPPAVVIATLLDGLLRLEHLDAVSIRLKVPVDGAPQEILRRSPEAEPGTAPRRASFRLGIGEEIGVLEASSARPDFPTPSEVLLLQVAASQAAIALQEARRFGEQRRAAQELERCVDERTAEVKAVKDELAGDLVAMIGLHQLGARLIAQRNLKDVLAEVLEATINLQSADFGMVQLYDEGEQALELLAQRGFNADFVERFRFVRSDTPSSCGRALAAGARVIVDDIETDPAFEGLRTAARASGFRAVQSTPLLSRTGRMLGMLNTQFRAPHRPSERELHLTDLYGRLAADLIERKQNDEDLRRTQDELAHVSRVTTLGELASSIAHEVNQPLAAVAANGAACLRWLAAQPPNLDEARAAVERVVRDANRAADVVSRVRAFVRRGAAQRSAMDVLDAMREAASLVLDRARHHDVGINVVEAPRLPMVLADRVQLQQVLVNLAINAIEAMSMVSGRPRVLEFEARESAPDGVLVMVRDCGPGLPPGQRERVFEPFLTTKADGMGMGLAISRSIIEAHSGKLWATPNPAGGECFQFTLPTSPTAPLN
ncbi:MAG TPA: GAF domain-containing protein [Burkholderiales bacterium]|nr:GAF domain-containing protein [Burkholderiales bacterium]